MRTITLRSRLPLPLRSNSNAYNHATLTTTLCPNDHAHGDYALTTTLTTTLRSQSLYALTTLRLTALRSDNNNYAYNYAMLRQLRTITTRTITLCQSFDDYAADCTL